MAGITPNSNRIANDFSNMAGNQAKTVHRALGNSVNIDPNAGVDIDGLADASFNAKSRAALKTSQKTFDMYFWKKIHNEGLRHSEMLMQDA